MNDIILNLINDESGEYKGKKLLASGNESLSFVDIHNLLRQTYTNPSKAVESKNNILSYLFDNYSLFMNGNNHVTNFKFMLDFLQVRNPQFSGYESSSGILGQKAKSFREYYVQKAEKFDDRINSILDEQPEDFRFPPLQNYHKISLD